jgi:hypothetical protein
VETVEKFQNHFPTVPTAATADLQSKTEKLPLRKLRTIYFSGDHGKLSVKRTPSFPQSQNSKVSLISPNAVTNLSEPYMDEEGVKA